MGEIGDSERRAFLGNAAALLFPIDWPEPFGLVVIEAMACGTPVVAWRCGAVPEVIDDGVSGFIVMSEDEAMSAVERASSVNRSEIRRAFERRFISKVMARNYLALYWSLAHGSDPDLKVAAVG
jgi:glycosyltransferase involved in cell wall biosynthesis